MVSYVMEDREARWSMAEARFFLRWIRVNDRQDVFLFYMDCAGNEELAADLRFNPT